ncbi:MAG TPA: NAD(P)-dependent oxidoreductase [Gemmatimonadota bacterium]|nr:NAD(P)-dependent oxidoreductase [Gemmatimonadota bacterium]
MKAIVTGGAGFIGSHLIEGLLEEGHEVTCVERQGGTPGWIRHLPVAFEPIGLDDVAALQGVFEGVDVVFHLAGLTEAARPSDLYQVNTEGTAQVLRAAAAFNGSAPRVILMSSLAASGPCRNGDPLSPDSVPFPLSHYGNSKLLAEAMMHAYEDRVRTTIIRLPSAYGPRERSVLTLFRMIKRGIALTIGGWERPVSLIYVKDVVQGLLAAARCDAAVGRTYCLAHPDPVTWAEFADAGGRAIGRSPVLLSLPSAAARPIALACELAARVARRAAVLNRDRVRELSQQSWVCDPSRAIDEIGFAPAWPLDRGAAETVSWYRKEAWL